ncbi:endonuclease/exonuclease/phosphatase family protein [Corynebacterium lubricantis]|uniref:endonuclease/exonuclease/phosphatase family protein n=1 Tax=Corynebacterium lubricantis TaxID=541095 RepID=UPI00036D8557|nr:endonuclease/exonuclease/phosphatase family protein [Corynebacterium lubricantis]
MISILLWGLAVLTLVLALLPGPLSTVPGFAHVLAFPHISGALLIIAIVFVVWKTRRWRLPATAVVLAAALLVMFPAASPLVSAPSGAPASGGESRPLTIVSFNSKHTFTAKDFEQLQGRFHPDVYVLPETDLKRAEIALRGSNFQIFVSGDGRTSVAVASSLSDYVQVDAPDITFGAVALEHASLPTIVGLHSAPPLPDLMGQWRDDLQRVGEFDGGENLIVAGDFNATLRHGTLGERENLVDAFQECGSKKGSWPAALPSLMRTQIDHVFVSPEIHVARCEAVEIGRSDHLALAVTLALQGENSG